MEIRRSYDRLISKMGFPMLVRWHLYIESAPRPQWVNILAILKRPCSWQCSRPWWFWSRHGQNFNTVTSWWVKWCLKSLACELFTQPYVLTQIKENIKTLHQWPLWGELTGDCWVPSTKGQLFGKCFHLMTSSCCCPWLMDVITVSSKNSMTMIKCDSRNADFYNL